MLEHTARFNIKSGREIRQCDPALNPAHLSSSLPAVSPSPGSGHDVGTLRINHHPPPATRTSASLPLPKDSQVLATPLAHYPRAHLKATPRHSRCGPEPLRQGQTKRMLQTSQAPHFLWVSLELSLRICISERN